MSGRTISCKVTDQEFLVLSQQSESLNITMSDMIRQALLTAKIVDKKTDRELQKERLYSLNRIGNNLNQIAKNCNTKKVIDRLVLEELISIREDLQKC